MLARLAGVHGLASVPMVGRGNHHRINVLPLEDVAVIPVRRRLPPSALDRRRKALFVHVTDRNNVDVAARLPREHVAKMAPAHAAHTDVRDVEAILGARLGVSRPQNARGQNLRQRKGARGERGGAAALEKTATRKAVHCHDVCV